MFLNKKNPRTRLTKYQAFWDKTNINGGKAYKNHYNCNRTKSTKPISITCICIGRLPGQNAVQLCRYLRFIRKWILFLILRRGTSPRTRSWGDHSDCYWSPNVPFVLRLEHSMQNIRSILLLESPSPSVGSSLRPTVIWVPTFLWLFPYIVFPSVMHNNFRVFWKCSKLGWSSSSSGWSASFSVLRDIWSWVEPCGGKPVGKTFGTISYLLNQHQYCLCDICLEINSLSQSITFIIDDT